MAETPPYFLPGPQEYEQAKAEIRARWSDEERLKRMRVDWRPVDWAAPEVEEMEGDAGGNVPT